LEGIASPEEITIVLWGLGAMGSELAKLIMEKKWIRIVGALEKRPEHLGKDLGEALGLGKNLGVVVSNDPETVLRDTRPDVVLIATSSFVDRVYPQITQAMEHGANVITTAEEMVYPWTKWPDVSTKIDRIAKEHKVTVLGTGVNPGFVLDTLVIVLTAVCAEVYEITAVRINDLSPYGPSVLRSQGVGISPSAFEEGVRQGTIVGHVGFTESISMICARLGLKLDRIEESREPIISKTHRETPYVKVSPGNVAGCKQIARGYVNGKPFITLEHPQQVHPESENVKTGDFISINGRPSINLSIEPEIAGGIATAAIAVNMIPTVVNASPGLATMASLPIPAAVLGDISRTVSRTKPL
jgi:hypothetical protein